MNHYKNTLGEIRLPVTEEVARRSIVLPLFSDMSKAEVRKIRAAIVDVYRHGSAIRQHLSDSQYPNANP